MPIIKRLVLAAAFILPWAFSSAQGAWTIYNTGNSGIPDNTVRCLAIDPTGKKWAGTDIGLAVYDDVSWTVYNTSNSNIPSNEIRSIAFDMSGNAWVGTFDDGLAMFDGVNWTIYNTSNSGLPDNFIKCISIDGAGTVWAGTTAGFIHFDGGVWDVYDITNSALGSNNIGSILADTATGFLAIGTVNGGLLTYDTAGWTSFNIWNSTLPDNTILGIDRDSAGTLWMSTPASGITAYVGSSLFFTQSTASSAIASNSTTCIKYAGGEEFWIGSADSGLIRKSGQNFSYYSPFNSPMPDEYIYCVAVDDSGIVWAGTQQGGLVRLDPSQLTGLHPTIVTQKAAVYPSPAVTNIHVSSPASYNAIEIYNMSGQLVYSVTESSPTVINVEQLPDGIYSVALKKDRMVVSGGRFVKM